MLDLASELHIRKISESEIQLHGSPAVLMEAWEYFTFRIPNAHFDPRVQNKLWDGLIHLINRYTWVTFAGLKEHLKIFAKERGYRFTEFPEDILDEISVKDIETWIEETWPEIRDGAGNIITPDDYQIRGVTKALRYRRRTLVFPTGGGKSLIAWLIINWLFWNKKARKICIIVPTTTLVDQMASDFQDYGWTQTQCQNSIHKIYAGVPKHVDKPVTITTWQSAILQSKDWFERFDAVIADEAHGCKASSLKTILLGMRLAKYRIGLTGSLNEEKVHKLVIEGLLGPVTTLATIKEMQDKGRLAQIRVKGIVLHYPQTEIADLPKKMTYDQEIKWLVDYEPRNRFITNLALSLKGNTLVMFHLIEKHGDLLFEMLERKRKPTQPLFYIHGEVHTDDRTKYRLQTENEENAILLCSYGTFQMGINIKRLHNIIFASGFKSTIRNKQTLGRGLRRGSDKNVLSLYDLADDLRLKDDEGDVYGKENYSLSHFLQRIELYEKEGFPYQIYNVALKEKGEK